MGPTQDKELKSKLSQIAELAFHHVPSLSSRKTQFRSSLPMPLISICSSPVPHIKVTIVHTPYPFHPARYPFVCLFPNLLSSNLLNRSLQSLRIGTNNLSNLIAILEDEEGGHGADTELLGDVWDLVDVDLGEVYGGEFVGEPVCSLLVWANWLRGRGKKQRGEAGLGSREKVRRRTWRQ